MKRLLTVVSVSVLLFGAASNMKAAGITLDPALTAAIIAQTDLLKSEYKKRSQNHNKIEVAQAAITVAMDNVHKVEETIIQYLGNASGALQNLYQLKQIAELVVTDIPKNLTTLASDIPSNLKGTGITFYVNNTIAETSADIVALSDIVHKLVTSKYSLDNVDKNSPNINLLSAAERYSILNDVLQRLRNINRRIYLSDFFIKYFSWRELWMGIDRESWCNAVYGQFIAKQLINNWKKL